MWSTEISKGKSYEETVKNQILETLENMYVLEDHMGGLQSRDHRGGKEEDQ